MLPFFLSAALLPSALADDAAVATAINQFGLDLHRRLAMGSENLVTSPWSIESALAMTWGGADGNTREEMAVVLHFDGEENSVHAGFKTIAADLRNLAERSQRTVAESKEGGGPSTPFEIRTANRLFASKDHTFKQPFLDLTADKYQAPLEPMDFVKSPETASEHINEWVEDATEEKIRELIPPGLIDGDTRLVLTNAIYFKAPWENEFRDEKDAPFYVGGKDLKKLPGLMRREKYGYLKIPGGVAVSVPYAGDGIQFVLFVPDERDGLAAMEKTLTAEHLAQTAAAPNRDIILHFPKFKLTPDTVRLAEFLIKMGMPTAFNVPADSADFSRMAPRKPDDYLYLSHVVHKAFIEVDKHGTEAAAATAVIIARAGSAAPVKKKPEPLEIHVDHPFAFAIQHRSSGACLFLGRVSNPAK